MKLFYYTVKDKKGHTARGQGEAGSKKELLSRLRGQGFFVISVQEDKVEKISPQKTNKKFQGKRNSIKIQDYCFLARNLATMLSSGITLLRSLNLVAYQTESLKLAKVMKQCSESVRGGLSFEKAIREHPAVFSDLWAGIVEVGEASGNLPSVLNRLADYLEMRMEFERKIKSALVYPIILVCAVSVALFVFLKFIFPQFEQMFSQFDITMPALTVYVLSIAGFLERNFFFFLGGAVLAVIAFFRLKRRPDVKKILDKLILKMPLIGDIVFLGCVERFASVFYILLESGLALVYSLNSASSNIGNTVLEKQLANVNRNVKEGGSLSEELNRAGIFPILVVEMAKIGEETGSMPDVFKKVAAHYQKELSTTVERLVAAFEPLMIVFMGLVVGTIVISLFLPIFQLATPY